MKPMRDLKSAEMAHVEGGDCWSWNWRWNGGGGGGGSDPFLSLRLFFQDFLSLFLRVNL